MTSVAEALIGLAFADTTGFRGAVAIDSPTVASQSKEGVAEPILRTGDPIKRRRFSPPEPYGVDLPTSFWVVRNGSAVPQPFPPRFPQPFPRIRGDHPDERRCQTSLDHSAQPGRMPGEDRFKAAIRSTRQFAQSGDSLRTAIRSGRQFVQGKDQFRAIRAATPVIVSTRRSLRPAASSSSKLAMPAAGTSMVHVRV